MFPTRQATAAVTASRLLATALFAVLVASADARAQAPAAGTCRDAAGITLLPSPVAPWKGAPLRVVIAAEKAIEGELSLVAPDGRVAAASHERHGGTPYFWYAEVATPAAGTWQAKLTRQGASADCRTITHAIIVRAEQPPRLQSTAGSIWPVRGQWTRANEDLFSAWIERLFDAPLDASLSWSALHEVLRDRSRNLLFNHLGLREDELGMVIRPDCADLPYFLRAYFAFKLGLPFGYSTCTRPARGAPRCPAWWNIQNPQPVPPPPEPKIAAAAAPGQPVALPVAPPEPKPLGLAASFGRYVATVGGTVHSASARTWASDDKTDYYPVSLSETTVRPGTIYADPYGHILMIVKRVPQSGGGAGVFLAVDGQPDGTVARKRFWRGNFLFAQGDKAIGSPGFKRFRPVVRDLKSGGLRRLTNAEIAKNPHYADFSLDQTRLGTEDFYDRMDDLMSPAPLDPLRAIKEAITSLEEQVKARVTSVENGRKFQNSGKGEAAMPDGPAIFETTGAWEDFATPSRDLRLLIAIDVVKNFPERVARRPERYAMPAGKSAADVRAELQAVLASELASRQFAYPRSDGSSWTLKLKDVIDRAGSLEMAYNVNDCVELRWGAAGGSEEATTCKRRAPAAQRSKMDKYRVWFHERRRPARA